MTNQPQQVSDQIDAMQKQIDALKASYEASEAARQNIEAKYHIIFESAGDSIFIIDLNTFQILEANEHAARRLGYERDELLKLNIGDVEILPDNTPTDNEGPTSWRSSFSKTHFYECHYRRKDGTLMPVEVSSRLDKSDGVRIILNIVRDITHRKELEAARKRAEAEALRLATVIQQATETVVITDLNGDIVYANPYWEVATGYKVEEAINQNSRILKSGKQDQFFYANLWATITNGENWKGTFTNKRKDGRLYYEEATIFPIKDAGQKITHYAAVKRDITERVLAEREREELISELDAFSHTVAHDLKAPLAVIRGYAGLLLEGMRDFSDTQKQEMLLAIDNGGQKMANIIDDIMLLASTRQSEMVEPTPLDMIAIVKEALKRLKLTIEDQNAEIVYVDDENWPTAVGYGPWVEEIWANYISNAIKYGGDAPRIELGAERESEGLIRFWVRDYGDGLSPEKQLHLFKPFTRLGDVHIQGHGLGLSIVQRITNKLGGQVGVESIEGQGSTFSFTLPAAPIAS